MTDNVDKPDHYTFGKYECIDIIEELAKQNDLQGVEGFLYGNVIKYLWRYKHKNGVEDLKKAKWYLERLIKKSEFHKVGFRVNEEGKTELIDPVTHEVLKTVSVNPLSWHIKYRLFLVWSTSHWRI